MKQAGEEHLTPVAVCEDLLGGIEVVSTAAGNKKKTGYAWRGGSAWRDAGDFSSVRSMRRLLVYSKRHKKGLTPEHLIWGASRAEIDRILAARQQPELARVG